MYGQRGESTDLSLQGFRNRSTRIIANMIERLDLKNKAVLEIGGGDSSWLIYFAEKYPESKFAALDYSHGGCERLRRRFAQKKITNGKTYEADFLGDPKSLEAAFDIVLSFGVVEHFKELHDVLLQKKKYLKTGGVMLTLIPNLAGVYGGLAKKWNPKVYDAHNPHDWESFAEGHRKANLDIVEGGYLGTSEFGLLSMCFAKAGHPHRIHFLAYLWLTRLSKLLHLFEDCLFSLPATKLFSPYLYAVSRPSQERR